MTESHTPWSFNVHIFISERIGDERKGKGKDVSNVEIVRTLVGFRGNDKGKHTGNGKSEGSVFSPTSLALMITIMMTTRLNPQTRTKLTTIQLTLEVTTKSKPWTSMMKEHDTFSSNVALHGVTAFEAAELDAIALLTDTWDKYLDPDRSAQLTYSWRSVGASERTCISVFGQRRRKRGREEQGKISGPPVAFVIGGPRLKKLIAKTDWRACGRKGHWAHDRECAMSSSDTNGAYGNTTTSLHPDE